MTASDHLRSRPSTSTDGARPLAATGLLVATVVIGVILWQLQGDPRRVIVAACSGRSWSHLLHDDPVRLVVSAAGALAWLTLIRLVVAATLIVSVPSGHRGSSRTRAAMRLLPRWALPLVSACLSVPVLASAAAADTALSTLPSLDRPAVAPELATTAPSAAADTRTAAPPTAQAPGAAAASSMTSIVRPGDSLWSITARSLGPGATDAEIAQQWPLVWHANEARIGSTPGLIEPGWTLSVPHALLADSATTASNHAPAAQAAS